MEKQKEVEKSIITTFRKTIWKKFVAGINEYKLIEDNDKIAVCLSGGKDSMLLAKCFQELKKHGKNNFELEFLVIDPGYSSVVRESIVQNANLLGVPIKIFEQNIYDYVASVKEGSPCYLCARMRRGTLYHFAKQLGCNKIALGHHFDDVIETTLMSIFYNGQIKTMMPKLHSQNFENMQLIRPLYKVREKDIIAWRDKNNLKFINCSCRFTEMCDINQNKNSSKRAEMKQLVKHLESINPFFPDNLFTSLHNVNLNTMLGYQKDGKKHFFLDEYETNKISEE